MYQTLNIKTQLRVVDEYKSQKKRETKLKMTILLKDDEPV